MIPGLQTPVPGKIAVPVVLAAAYLLLTLGACSVAPKLMFFPQYGGRAAVPGSVALPLPDGSVVHAVHLPNSQARFTIWYFHGNAEDLGDVAPTLQRFVDAGFAVWVCDYPGYGRSTGQPTEESLYAAARAARRHLRENLRVPAERTIIWGRSLGGGPATQMATEERVGGLVLECTFVSAYRVVTRVPLFPFDPFQNLNKIGRVNTPVLVMHGTADEVIPFAHGEKLFAAASEPKRFLRIEGARHNDFAPVAGPRYLAAVRDFTSLCERASSPSP